MDTIRLRTLVVANPGAASAFPTGKGPADLGVLVQQLNGYFAIAGIQFSFDPHVDVDEIYDGRLNNDFLIKGDFGLAMLRKRESLKFPEAVTLLFRDGGNKVAANYSGGDAYYVVLDKSTMDEPTTVAHELGHYFHLAHTHRDPEPAREDVEEYIRQYIEDQGNPVSNWMKALEHYDGDKHNVGDTPFDLGARIFGDLPTACAPNAQLKLTVKFNNPNLDPIEYTYKPSTRSNLMSYFFRCQFTFSFSPDQAKVIRRTLDAGNRLRLLKGREWDSAAEQDRISPAAVSRKDDTVALFATDEDGRLFTKVWDAVRDGYWPSNEGWHPLSLGGYEGPIAHARRPDTIDLFVRRMDGRLHRKVWLEGSSDYQPAGQIWTRDIESNALIEGRPTLVSRQQNLLDVFVRLIDGSILTRHWNGNWLGWEALGGEGVGAPAAVARRTNIIDLFARWPDGTIRSKVWNEGAGWYPSQDGWTNLGGRGYDAPCVVSRQPETLDLFARWDDGTIRYKKWNDGSDYWPGLTTWENLGGQMSSEPVAVCRHPHTIALFARGSSGNVAVKVWDDSRGSWWPGPHDWFDLGGQTVGRPAVVARGQKHIVLYARWIDGSIRSKVWNEATSEWWPGETSWHSLGKPMRS